jgi:hypothetical protein
MITNYLSPLEFRVTIDRLPHVEFFTQQTNIPGISSSPVVVPTRFNKTYHSGEEIEFSNLDLTFIVDEKMENYREIFSWIVGLNFPENHQQYTNVISTTNDRSVVSDMSIIVMNSKKNPSIAFRFKNCFPISLGEVSLNTTDTDVVYPQVTASFQYDTFDIEMLTQ